MKQFNLKKEIPILLLVIIPYLLLLYLWNRLPQEIPIHYKASGVADGWADKSALIWLVSGMMLTIYVIFKVVPILDPRIKLEKMGRKYHTITFWTVFFFSIITSIIVYSSYDPRLMQSNMFMMIIALFLAVLGNYFKTIPPNYFIGIKTPWTLENKAVWKKTHAMGGQLWLFGGLLLFFLGFVLSQKVYVIVLVIVALLLAFIPMIYSYTYYQKLKNNES